MLGKLATIAVAAIAFGAFSGTLSAADLVRNDDNDVPRGAFLQFTCTKAKVGNFDPIADTTHRHIFVGRTSIGPDSTPETLKKSPGDTTCFSYRAPDRNAYWFPVTREGPNHEQMALGRVAIYYSDEHIRDGDLEHQFPPGLEMIGGGSRGPVQWRCMGQPPPSFDDDGRRVNAPPLGCKGATRFIAHFPNCWDQNGTGPDDVVFRIGECPPNEIRIPDLRVAVDFLPRDGRLNAPVEVSSGMGEWSDAYTFHADRMDGISSADGDGGETIGFELLVQRCLLDMPPGPGGPQPPLYCFPHLEE
jgi:hypothetical protein